MKQRIRVAVIGPGSRGLNLVRQWNQLGIADVVAVSDIRQEGIERAREALAVTAPACTYFTSNTELLQRDDLDLVFVTTHDAYHAAPALAALNAGKNVFVEKPITQNAADAAALVEAARRNGVQLFAGHEMQHCDFILHAQRRIAEGAIGKPRLAVSMDSCGRMGNYFRRPNTRTREEIIALTLQKGVHQLDIQALLLDARPRRAFAVSGPLRFGGNKPNDLRCRNCPEITTCAYAFPHSRANGNPVGNPEFDLCVFAQEIDVPDHVCATIAYDSGVCGNFTECFFTPEYKVEHRIVGDEGQIDILYKHGFPSRVRLTRLNSMTVEEEIFSSQGGHGGGDERLAEAVYDAIVSGQPARPDGLDGYYAVAVAEAIALSEQTGEPQDITLILD